MVDTRFHGTMNLDETVDILNELLEWESKSVLPHLGGSGLFVTWASADDRAGVDRMIAEEIEHRRWLVEAIRDLGGDPVPVWADIASADLHYLHLSHLLPRIVADRRRVLALYQAAAGQVGTNPRAAQVIGRIMDRHRRHVEALEKIAARMKSAKK